MEANKITLEIVTSLQSLLENWENNYLTEYREMYDQSGIKLIFSDYTRRVNIISVFISFMTFLISATVNEIYFGFTLTRNILSSTAISVIFGSIALLIGHVKPAYQRSQIKSFLENNLLYSISYMSCLSSSGMPIEKIFRRVGEIEDNPPFKVLINKFLVNVNLLGLDVLSALEEMAEQSPSKTLAKQIASIRTTLITSGDLKNLLLYEVDRLLQKKREVLKNSINTLVYIGEIYVTMMVVTPVLFILMITILSIMNGGMGGGSVLQLNLIIFFGLPVMAAAFIIILDQVLVIEE